MNDTPDIVEELRSGWFHAEIHMDGPRMTTHTRAADTIEDLRRTIERLEEQKNAACLDRDAKWIALNRAEKVIEAARNCVGGFVRGSQYHVDLETAICAYDATLNTGETR